MTYIKYVLPPPFWGLVALCLVTVSFANRGLVELKLLPEAIAAALPAGLGWLAPVVQVPLFVALLIGGGARSGDRADLGMAARGEAKGGGRSPAPANRRARAGGRSV